MTTEALVPAAPTIDYELLEQVLIKGDLRQLSPAEKFDYYKAVCLSVGVNALTLPFAFIVLNNKEVLYALKSCTDQLRRIYNVDVKIVGREITEDCYVVTARATLPNGRSDEDSGVVALPTSLKGDARANAMMRCTTKAKRRVTLSLVGLGMLDETEVESIPGAVTMMPRLAQSEAGQTLDLVMPPPEGPPSVDEPLPERGGVPLTMPPPPPNPGGVIVDRMTGEELKKPPAGFHYVKDYKLTKNGFHQATILDFDAQGGAAYVSTNREYGAYLESAALSQTPVKLLLTLIPGNKDRYYLDAKPTLLPGDIPF